MTRRHPAGGHARIRVRSHEAAAFLAQADAREARPPAGLAALEQLRQDRCHPDGGP